MSFLWATETLFWTSGDVCPGFQSQGGLACMLLRGSLSEYVNGTPQ